MSKGSRCFPYFFTLALVGAEALVAAPAMAQKVECSAIMGKVEAGRLYAVTVLKGANKGLVKIETIKGYCLEPTEKWKARGLPMASLGSGSFIAPPKKKKKIYTPPPIPTSRLTAPPPSSNYRGRRSALPPPGEDKSGNVSPGGPAKSTANLTGKAGTASEEAIPKPPVRKGPCDRAITDFWSPGNINIKGSTYWLSGAFTVDLDGDGRVDNVGFKLKITGRVGNVIRYFGAPGRLSGQTIPDLKIANDDDISRLCPGNVTFKLPKSERPAAENKIEVSREPTNKAPVKKKKGLSGLALAVFSGAGVVLFVSGIVILFLLQPEFAARRREKKEAEEEDEEDEES